MNEDDEVEWNLMSSGIDHMKQSGNDHMNFTGRKFEIQ
jgi:hypothetical protein